MTFNQVAQYVYIVYEDRKGNLIISVTDCGMYRLNKETDTFEPYFHHKEYRFIERIIGMKFIIAIGWELGKRALSVSTPKQTMLNGGISPNRFP